MRQCKHIHQIQEANTRMLKSSALTLSGYHYSCHPHIFSIKNPNAQARQRGKSGLFGTRSPSSYHQLVQQPMIMLPKTCLPKTIPLDLGRRKRTCRLRLPHSLLKITTAPKETRLSYVWGSSNFFLDSFLLKGFKGG